MLYIIPFVLLLVVAIVLKKRGSGQQDADSNKSKRKIEPKKKAKARSGAATTEVTEAQNTVTAEAKPKELDPNLRRQIENLIREKNFNTAEALINQALNADNTQHDLYLLLLQLHLEQNDQFSINQLMSHLRALKLEEIITEAEQRLEEKKEPVKTESIQYTPIQLPDEEPASATTSTPAPAVEQPVQKAPESPAIDFDQLKSGLNIESSPEPDTTPSHLSFDKLQEELHSTSTPALADEQPATAEPEEHKPLEFSLEGFSQPETIQPAKPEVETSDLVIEPHTPETQAAEKFNFDKLSEQVPEVANTEYQEAITELQFDIAEPPVAEAVEKTAEAPVLEFKFDFAEPAVQEKPAEPVVETAPQTEVAFSFDKLETQPQVEPQPVAETPDLAFSFDQLDVQAKAEPEPVVEPSIPAVEFTTEPVAVDSIDALQSPAEPASVVTTQPVVATAEASADYVLQQFPELAELNDAELNLSLAEQYIRLGAFSSARALLEDAQLQYNSDELDRAKYLLNQIAS